MKREDLLDLNDVLQHPGRTLAVDIDTELESQSDVDLLEPVSGFLEAVSTGNLLLLTGEFKTRVNLDCARCLAPLGSEIIFTLDEQFPVEGVPSSFSSQDTARIASDEPFEMFEGNSLIVEVLLREALLISIPIQPLCPHGWDEPCPVADAQGIAPRANPNAASLGPLADLLREKKDEDKA